MINSTTLWASQMAALNAPRTALPNSISPTSGSGNGVFADLVAAHVLLHTHGHGHGGARGHINAFTNSLSASISSAPTSLIGKNLHLLA